MNLYYQGNINQTNKWREGGLCGEEFSMGSTF